MFSLIRKAYLSQDFYLFFCVFFSGVGWGEMIRAFLFLFSFFLSLCDLYVVWGVGWSAVVAEDLFGTS